MKKDPLVSVIIPTYNRAWCLEKAVNSVLNQNFKDFEIIVVDDGSTDNTLDILKKFKEKIKVLKQCNQGVSSARNNGIRNSKGFYISFLDSDDLWLPQKLCEQISFFKLNPEALICQTEEIWIRNGKRVNPKIKHKKLSGFIFEESLLLCLVSPSAVMMKKILLDETGMFDENLPACEDYDFWLRIGYKYPVYLIKTPLIIKNGGHKDQLSRSPMLDKYRILSIKKILDSEKLSETQFNAGVKVLQQKCEIYISGCIKRGKGKEIEYFTHLAKKFKI